MPELPEVETVRRVLLPHLKNREIERVAIYSAGVIAFPGAEEFTRSVTGARITDLKRRGKYLRFLLSDGGMMVLHLRMTGCLTLQPAQSEREKHTHVAIALNGGEELRYEDVRRFGKFWYIGAGMADVSGAENLGIEPFDAALTMQYLQDRGAKRAVTIKQFLLDQRVIAGIGNIYSDEILFSAGILPQRACGTLTASEWAKLAVTIPERLQYFIDTNAISFDEYNAGKGRDYRNTPYLQVYGRAGKPCRKCGATLEHLTIGGRSSIFCPHCQK